VGNAYDYMNPRIIICDNNGECHQATSKEIEQIIREILEEMKR